MKTLIITLCAVSILILAYWVKNLRRENVKLESRVNQMENQVADAGDQARETAQLKSQLNYERQRLDGLRASLNEVVRLGTQAPASSYEAQISGLTSRISTLENRLQTLAQDSQMLKSNARMFQQGVASQAAMQGIGAVPAAPAQNLNAAAASQVQAEQLQLDNERAILQNELTDLRADLNFWRNLRDAPAERPARVRELELQIRESEARLNTLDTQVR